MRKYAFTFIDLRVYRLGFGPHRLGFGPHRLGFGRKSEVDRLEIIAKKLAYGKNNTSGRGSGL